MRPIHVVGATVCGAAVVSASIFLATSWRAAPTPSVAKAPQEPVVAERARGAAKQRPKPESNRRRTPGVHRAGPAELAERNRVAASESAKIQRQLRARQLGLAPAAPFAATEWVSLGPTNAPKQYNFFEVASVDSGRVSDIVLHPLNPDIVYVSTSGGGVWKTFNFLSATGATWSPISDTLPNLAVGALALDSQRPDTLYLGAGDFIDGSGNTVFKTTDGGSTWGPPVELVGEYPGGIPANVSAIRHLGVDRNKIYAATNAGLFKSTDGGATFELVDLPNVDGKLVTEGVWSLAPLGEGGWIASGVTACDVGLPPPGVFGSDIDPVRCPLGNNAAVWRSDDGEEWSLVTGLTTAGTQRTTLASAPAFNPSDTVAYLFVGAVNGAATVGFWRSKDGGRTWANATGTLANPTLVEQNGDDTCADLDVGHGQSWYNQAIVVDPLNPNNVLVGGNLCGMRTLNGLSDTPTWENVSHWLPGTGFGETANGRLSYVHADWHAATSAFVRGKLRTVAGSDGGIFSSDNVFSAATAAEEVQWTHRNRGLATHLFYSVASGDPTTGNPFLLYGGLQDNGTRFRADPKRPSEFNQPIGGDGIGGTVHTASSGTTYWASVQFSWQYCKPAEVDCSVEVPEATTDEESHWHAAPSPIGLEPEQIAERAEEHARILGEDSAPFLVRYANVETDTVGQSVLIHTDRQIFVSEPDGAGFTWRSISQDLTDSPIGAGFTNVAASRTIPGLYGAAGLVSAAPFFYTTQGNTKVDWTAARPVFPTGTTVRLLGASSIDFPPVTAPGRQPGQEFIGGFTGPTNDAARNPPPADKGHLWRTIDGGQTWQSIVGADPARRLPNVSIYVVKYDPVTPSTIYVGNELGLYVSKDNGATWDRFGNGLPVVPVRDIYIAKNLDFIRVATYGRGLWEIYPSATANQGAPGNGDYDRNLKLDWVDLAALSTRLGTTPATTAPPFYSWIMDLSGGVVDNPVQSIDGDDLAALLANFGGNP
jgi:hypothetical protein